MATSEHGVQALSKSRPYDKAEREHHHEGQDETDDQLHRLAFTIFHNIHYASNDLENESVSDA
jgi:hypothetical protein